MSSRLRQFVQRWVLPFADPRQLASAALLPRFFVELHRFQTLAGEERVRLRDAYPCLADRLAHTPFDPHYFYQGAWLARRMKAAAPSLHVDVGSSVLMVSVLSAQAPLVLLDYRPLHARLPGLTPVAADITRLPFQDRSLESVSSLHVVEHVGLGRYGDRLDPEGSRRAARELARVVAPRGRLYLSVPAGRQRVCFNAHRVFAAETILALFADLQLASFALVDDSGCFEPDAALAAARELDYGCGMFEFVRRDD